jgi:hypothetical protein
MNSDSGTWKDVPARRADPPAPKLVRTLWVMTRPPNKSVTCGIYENVFGRELRTYYSSDESNLLDSVLSRTGDEPLQHRAGELRAVLVSQGWSAPDGPPTEVKA